MVMERMHLVKLPPGASTSLNSPGCIGDASSLTLTPLCLNPAGKFDKVPASKQLTESRRCRTTQSANHMNESKAIKSKSWQKFEVDKILDLIFL